MLVLPGALWMGLGVAVGSLSGFLGVGGGVVLTPLFLYLGYSPKVATATALAFVIPTAWASIMKGHEHADVTLAVLLAVGAVVGAYAIGQLLVQSPHLDPRLYKKIFGLLLLVMGLDLVTGATDALRQHQEQRATPFDKRVCMRVSPLLSRRTRAFEIAGDHIDHHDAISRRGKQEGQHRQDEV